jgi:murein DD-endopeptidase MepM/ murein hydrolase activator NlpD
MTGGIPICMVTILLLTVQCLMKSPWINIHSMSKLKQPFQAGLYKWRYLQYLRRITMLKIQSKLKIIYITFMICMALSLIVPAGPAFAFEPSAITPPKTELQQIWALRLELFEHMSTLSGIPWFYLAAIDQYDRSISFATKRPTRPGLVGIYITESDWAGSLNPDPSDTNPDSITLFRGLGRDGSGDDIADRNNDLDLLTAVTAFISAQGKSVEDLKIGLWHYYQNSRSVQRIEQFARIYEANATLDLHEHAFPLPVRSEYSYRSTWGAKRGWGGLRTHEGTDLFASYGVPVRSTSHGVIEVMGWNPFGGWRIGIRDLNNVYHYYAHLSGFNKKLKANDIVKPGEVIGWVGSSGYGKPGTSGKFPPHLHYGLYRDSGLTEWSFDPYSYLRKWEREDTLRIKQKTK